VNTGLAPYRIENLLIDGFDVVVNKPRVAPYRAPGTPQAAFAVETVIDELAEQLGLDPLEFRLKNAARDGDRQPSGVPHGSVGIVQLLETMRDHAHYQAPLVGDHRGRGVAIGYWSNGGLNSSASIHVNSDGTINLITGSPDIGGSRAALAMQAAEVLGLRAEDVNPSVADTDSIGWTGVTGGSRVAFSTGIAVIQAAEDIKQKMHARAALIWEVRPEDVDCVKGLFVNTKNPEDQFTFRELAGRLLRTGGPISATGTSNPRGVGAGVAGTIVDVEVDPDTGKVAILRATCFQDVGAAMHPSYVEGQMQAGTVQGIGWALNEEYYFDAEGAMVNPTFLDYRMPTSLDLPMIETVMVTVPNPHHPFGARGVGEVSIVPPVPAIANVVPRGSDPALGERVRPWRLRGCPELSYPESSQAPIKRFAIPAVPVTDEIPRWIPIPATGVHDLLGSPVGGGMSSHPNLQDLPSLVMHHEEDVQRPEEHRPYPEEVARPDVLGMAGQERPPGGRWNAVVGPAHVLGDGPGRHRESQPRELCLDTPLSP
jgi:xanthine dehydrogenase molybdenum-binding subunit